MAIEPDSAAAADVLRRGLAAVAALDWDAVRTVCSPDVVWRIPGHGPLAGEVRGPDAVVDLFRTMQGATTGDRPARLVAVLEGPGHAALVQHNELHRPDGATTVTMVTLVAVRDGRITELQYLTSDQDLVDALWSERLA